MSLTDSRLTFELLENKEQSDTTYMPYKEKLRGNISGKGGIIHKYFAGTRQRVTKREFLPYHFIPWIKRFL